MTGRFEAYLSSTLCDGADDSYSAHSSLQPSKTECKSLLAVQHQPFVSGWELPIIVDQRVIRQQHSSSSDRVVDSSFSPSASTRYTDFSTVKPQSVRNVRESMKVDTQSTYPAITRNTTEDIREIQSNDNVEIFELLQRVDSEVRDIEKHCKEKIHELTDDMKSLRKDMKQRKTKEKECSMGLGYLRDELKGVEDILSEKYSEFDDKIDALSKQKVTLDEVKILLKESLEKFQQSNDKKNEDKLSGLCTEVATLTDLKESLVELDKVKQKFENIKLKSFPARVGNLEENLGKLTESTKEGMTRIQIRLEQIEKQQSESIIGQILSFLCIWKSVPENKKQKSKCQ